MSCLFHQLRYVIVSTTEWNKAIASNSAITSLRLLLDTAVKLAVNIAQYKTENF